MTEKQGRDLDNLHEWQRQDRLKHPEKYRARDRKRRAADPEKFASRHREWRMRNPDGPRNNNLKRNFGITAEQYDEMFAKQHGVCAICHCRQRIKRLAVDHNHKTGQIRGLLCLQCNQGLGRFFDSPTRLENAAVYIRQSYLSRLPVDTHPSSVARSALSPATSIQEHV